MGVVADFPAHHGWSGEATGFPLSMTFPFDISLGIPLYDCVASRLWG